MYGHPLTAAGGVQNEDSKAQNKKMTLKQIQQETTSVRATFSPEVGAKSIEVSGVAILAVVKVAYYNLYPKLCMHGNKSELR